MALESSICIFIKLGIISAVMLRLAALDYHQYVPSTPHSRYNREHSEGEAEDKDCGERKDKDVSIGCVCRLH